MTGYTAKGIGLAVKEEALLRVDLKGTATESGANVVHDLITLYDFCLAAVEVRIAAAVPQMHARDGEACLGLGGVKGCYYILFLVVDGVAQGFTLAKILYEYFNFNSCILLFYLGGDHQTLAAKVVKVKVGVVDANQVDISVKTAVEGEVRNLGIYKVIGGVVNDQSKEVVLGKLVGDVYTPGGVTTVVGDLFGAIDVEGSGGVCTVDLYIVSVSLGQVCLFDGANVAAGTTEVVVATVLTVGRIPTMGDGDLLPFSRDHSGNGCHILRKGPASV
jgi:hypothetical protein